MWKAAESVPWKCEQIGVNEVLMNRLQIKHLIDFSSLKIQSSSEDAARGAL